MFCKTKKQLSTLLVLLISVILCATLFCAVFLTLTNTKLQTAEAVGDITDKTVVVTAKYDASVVNMDFTPYEKFEDAWNDIMGTESISDGHFRYEVILLNNCELPETLTLMVHSIDLYLNGYKLSLSASTGSVFKVVDGGTLRIYDDTADSQFKQAYPDSYPYKKSEHSVTNPVTGETVTVNGGLITGGKGSDGESLYGTKTFGGAVFMGENAGDFMMYGGTIAGNTADYGGGIYTTAGGLISGGSITHNKAYLAGGGMFVENCEGAIDNQNSDMTISDNAAADGGGIYFSSTADNIWKIDGATIENNRAVKGPDNVEFSGKGGGIYLNYCPVSFESGVIRNNAAYDCGGGVYVRDTSVFTISGGTIESNTAEKGSPYVGGVYNERGTINIKGAPQFVNNALYLDLDMDYKKINVTGPLNGAKIEVQPYENWDWDVITSGYGENNKDADGSVINPKEYFSSDKCVYLGDDNEVHLKDHSFDKGQCTVCKEYQPIYWGVTAGNKLIISTEYSDVNREIDGIPSSFASDAVFASYTNVPWSLYQSSVRDIEIKGTVYPVSTENWFCSCSSVKSIDLRGLYTLNVKNMFRMFMSCGQIQSIDVSHFNTEKVTNFNQMFYNCSNLESLDLSSFILVGYVKPTLMFGGCISLKTIVPPKSIERGKIDLPCAYWDGSKDLTSISATDAGEGKQPLIKHNKHTYVQGICSICGDEAFYEVTANGDSFNYKTIEDAFNAANEATFATTVKMYNDAQINATLVVAADKNITLDLNGCSVTHIGESGSVIKTLGTFTLVDSGTGGTITGGKGTTVESKNLGGAIYVESGLFIMNGGILQGNRAEYGGGVCAVDNAVFTMNGGNISGNEATQNGGGVYLSVSKFTMDGGVIGYESYDVSGDSNKSNRAINGSGVALSGGSFILNDGQIMLNLMPENESISCYKGGGVYVSDGGTFDMRGGYINNNMVSDDGRGVSGGGVYIDNGRFMMSDGSMGMNCADNGGTVYVNKNGTFEMSGGSIATGWANNQGGGVYVDGTFTMSGGSISNIFSCGGVYVTAEGTFNVSGTLNISENSDYNVYLEGSNINVTGALASGTQIGISNTGVITSGYGANNSIDGKVVAPSTYFISDNPNKPCIYLDDENEVAINAHTGGIATCTDKAVCTNCKQKYGGIDSNNHNPATAWTVDGDMHYHICQNGCGEKFDTAAHTYNNIVDTKFLKSAATCEQKAVYFKSCVCGDKSTETFEGSDLGAHVLTSYDIVEATCTKDGKMAYDNCSVCGKNFIGDVEKTIDDLRIPMFGHTEVVDNAVAPTCTEAGKTAGKHCSVCDTVLVAQTTVEALGHDFGEWTVTKEPTADEYGEEQRVCSHDGTHVEKRQIEKLPAPQSQIDWKWIIILIVLAVVVLGEISYLIYHGVRKNRDAEDVEQ